jgi:hypothetical protein
MPGSHAPWTIESGNLVRTLRGQLVGVTLPPEVRGGNTNRNGDVYARASWAHDPNGWGPTANSLIHITPEQAAELALPAVTPAPRAVGNLSALARVDFGTSRPAGPALEDIDRQWLQSVDEATFNMTRDQQDALIATWQAANSWSNVRYQGTPHTINAHMWAREAYNVPDVPMGPISHDPDWRAVIKHIENTPFDEGGVTGRYVSIHAIVSNLLAVDMELHIAGLIREVRVELRGAEMDGVADMPPIPGAVELCRRLLAKAATLIDDQLRVLGLRCLTGRRVELLEVE